MTCLAKAKKVFGEGVTALAPEDVVKAYEEAHPKSKGKAKLAEITQSLIDSEGKIKDSATETSEIKEAAPAEIQLTDLEQLKRDVDSALTLLPRVKVLLEQIVILPDNQTG